MSEEIKNANDYWEYIRGILAKYKKRKNKKESVNVIKGSGET